jgi:glutamyl-tRNA synthetase
MHLGNASSALLAWLSVRSRAGTLVLRLEDLDRGRSRPEFASRILDDLAWLGFDWDEGPDRGGPHGPYDQGSRLAHYARAFERLHAAGRLYPCFCSRQEIARAASAPQEPGEESPYPGTCLALEPAEAGRRVERGLRHAWRFRIDSIQRPAFVDLVHGLWQGGSWPCGDFVVRRSDGVTAYQLAVVVDDAEMRIDEVVRGDDLLSSTLRQLVLYAALDARPPEFAHVPLLLGADGVRLSKRHRGITLRELRESGVTAPEIVGRLAALLGLRDRAGPVTPAELAADFSWKRVRRAPAGIPIG